MDPLLAGLFDSLDGASYFFVSSGIFFLVTAAIFFGLGLWMGALTWGKFKRRYFAARENIEDLKTEMALLKRRAADLAMRPVPGQSQAKSPPPSKAFTIWTAPQD